MAFTARGPRFFAAVAALALAAALPAWPRRAGAQAAEPPAVPLVTVDAGHGGPYPGAVNCAYTFAGKDCMQESDLNLDIALRTEPLLRREGFRVALTRVTDTAVLDPVVDIETWNREEDGTYEFDRDGVADVKDTLQARVNVANCGTVDVSCDPGGPDQAAAFVSIHNNACACGAGGTTTFSNPGSEEGARLAALIQEEVVERIQRFDRGAQVEAFYVLRWTRMPAALLEGAFVDNPEEARLLTRDTFRQKIARGVAAGVFRYFCTVEGTDGDDVLVGTEGDDVICGGRGDDMMSRGGGADVFLGGWGTDTVSFAASPAGVVADLASGTGTGIAGMAFDSVENLIGSPFDDSLLGSDGPNVLRGGGGNDLLDGREGPDTLVGGRGDDAMFGRAGTDLVSFVSLRAAVAVDLDAETATGQGADLVVGIEDVVGSPGPDTIVGDDRPNVLSGRGNDDVLDARDGIAGNDAVVGGFGRNDCLADEGDLVSGCP